MTATLQTEPQSRTYDATESAATTSVRVVEAVADALDANPLSMEPLSEAVDPDALNQLVNAGVDGHVAFAFAGCEVTVCGDETIVVEEVR